MQAWCSMSVGPLQAAPVNVGAHEAHAPRCMRAWLGHQLGCWGWGYPQGTCPFRVAAATAAAAPATAPAAAQVAPAIQRGEVVVAAAAAAAATVTASAATHRRARARRALATAPLPALLRRVRTREHAVLEAAPQLDCPVARRPPGYVFRAQVDCWRCAKSVRMTHCAHTTATARAIEKRAPYG
eukprot:364615-Chlamydomonas_euryale.AAC.13